MKKPVRVLHVLTGMGGGGAESFIMNMYRHMDRDQIQFDFLLRSDENMYEDELRSYGSRVVQTASFPRHLVQNQRQVRRFLQENPYDIIHVHANALIYMTALREAARRRVPCRIMHSHSTSMRYPWMLPYANRSSKCRKLHNIANSVLIFDEAQMLPPAHLRPCVAAIAQMVSVFGATAVLCTATQPVLNDLFAEYAPSFTPRELCPLSADAFSRFRRVSFRNAGELSSENLKEQLVEQTQALCIVNSRASAREVYLSLPEEGRYHLSTLMVPSHRRAVLCEIRQRLKDGLLCHVVSTSLIEAGVDVDFPAVWRELAGLDSILQAAGRCNREGKRSPEESIVTVFSGISKPPRLMEINISAAREVLHTCDQWDDPAAVHQYFSVFRTLAGDRLDQSNAVRHMKEGIAGCLLPFRTVANEFHLIDSSTKTVYIPWGDGTSLLRELLAGHYSRSLYRRLNQFSVNLYEPTYRSLLEAGMLQAIDDGSAILRAPERYDPKTGLNLETPADPIFI